MKIGMIAAAALALALAACGEGGTEAETYRPGMSKTAGGLRVALWSDPGPPRKGTNTLTLAVTEVASSEPVTGASVRVNPTMPSHGHGSDADPEVHEEGEGTYVAENVVLQMLGVWDIEIAVDAGARSGTVHFVFEVE